MTMTKFEALGIENEFNHKLAQQMMIYQHPEALLGDVSCILSPRAQVEEKVAILGDRILEHAEGTTLLDHTIVGMEAVAAMDLPPTLQRLAIVTMLVHDLGKITVDENEENLTATEAKLAKGTIGKAFYGHANVCPDNIREALIQNGVFYIDLEIACWAVRHHMRGAKELNPKSAAKMIEELDFGATDAELEQAIKLLAIVQEADNQATLLIKAENGRLVEFHLDPQIKLLKKQLEAGLKKLRQDQAAAALKTRIEDALGLNIGDWLQSQGFVQGKALGQAYRRIQATAKSFPELSGEELCNAIIGLGLKP